MTRSHFIFLILQNFVKLSWKKCYPKTRKSITLCFHEKFHTQLRKIDSAAIYCVSKPETEIKTTFKTFVKTFNTYFCFDALIVLANLSKSWLYLSSISAFRRKMSWNSLTMPVCTSNRLSKLFNCSFNCTRISAKKLEKSRQITLWSELQMDAKKLQ